MRPWHRACAAAAIATIAVLPAAALAGGDTKFYVRGGVLHMKPFVDSGEVVLSNLSDFATIAVDEGPIAGSGASVGSVTVPALIIGYVLPIWDGQIAVETILGPPVELSLAASGSIADESIAPTVLGDVPTGVPALGTELGTTKALPPMVTATYRFLLARKIHPYAGLGLAYMHPYDARITNPVLTEVSTPRLELGDSVGFVAQGGLEARFGGRYFATLDAKLIAMRMSATMRDVYVRTPALPIFESARVGDASVAVTMVPAVVFLGAGADF